MVRVTDFLEWYGSKLVYQSSQLRRSFGRRREKGKKAIAATTPLLSSPLPEVIEGLRFLRWRFSAAFPAGSRKASLKSRVRICFLAIAILNKIKFRL